jgi:nucleotide-binding universal stress UspA family protein
VQKANRAAAAGVATTFAVVEGAAAPAIVRAAGTSAADLLVLGTHGRSGFEHFVLGSVTERVLRNADCPVLTVPKNVTDAAPVPPPFKRILCAVDFSPSSMRALDYATSMAQEVDACLTVAHVFELEGAMPAQWRDVATPDSIRRELLSVEQDRRDRLAHAVPEAAEAFCKVDRVMRGGTPYREILRLAADRQAELLVLGVHGRGALDLAFFGSTTNHVVRQAVCPVLTVRGA